MKLSLLPVALMVALLGAAPGARAESAPQSAEVTPAILAEVIGFDGLLRQMAEEAMQAGLAMEGEVFPAQPEGFWQDRLAALYDLAPIARRFTLSLEESLQDRPEVMAAAMAFYGSEAGRRLFAAEMRIRQSFLQEEELEAAEVAVERAQEQRDPKLALVDEIIAAADLLDRNVLASLNSYRLFERGYDAALPLAERRSKAEVTEEAALIEPETREQNRLWLRAFFYQAYRDLGESDLRAILAYYRSQEGRAMMVATFKAYDAGFDEVSLALGELVGRLVEGQLI